MIHFRSAQILQSLTNNYHFTSSAINACAGGNNPCQNGGRCRPGYAPVTCDCLDGYTGRHCETREYIREQRA